VELDRTGTSSARRAACTTRLVPVGVDGYPVRVRLLGRQFIFRLLRLFEFADGRIRRENAWADMAAVAQ
jgi:hypothetical protein